MQKKIETTLARLIAIPSVTNDKIACQNAIEFVRGELEPLGLFIHTDIDRADPWLIATTKNTKTPATLLAAHLDTVPAAQDLFTMRREGDKLYGRGSFDMKFAAACFIEFAKAHVDILPSLDIGFLFSTDEEVGGASIIELIDAGWRPARVLVPDGGEDWQIEARAKGFFGIQLTASGKAAHGSRPWEGDNAIHTLMEMLTILRQEWPYIGKTDATFGVDSLVGGQAFNQIPDSATALLDFRSFSNQELSSFYKRLTSLAVEYGVLVSVLQAGSPVAFDKSSPAVQDFLEALHDIRGTTPTYIDSFGGTDARHFAKVDIPTIITQLRGGGRHAADEWIMAEDLETYYQLLVRWLVK